MFDLKYIICSNKCRRLCDICESFLNSSEYSREVDVHAVNIYTIGTRLRRRIQNNGSRQNNSWDPKFFFMNNSWHSLVHSFSWTGWMRLRNLETGQPMTHDLGETHGISSHVDYSFPFSFFFSPQSLFHQNSLYVYVSLKGHGR